jgi:hypothetical protein
MPDRIVIAGIPPYDGRYDLDFDSELTTREWGWIKRFAGYLPATMGDDAYSDPELVCAMAVIVLRRAGRIEPREAPAMFDRVADAPFGSTITVELDEAAEEVEDDAGPPAESSNASELSSGDSSTTSSETSELTQPLYGIPGSDTSVSVLSTSAT